MEFPKGAPSVLSYPSSTFQTYLHPHDHKVHRSQFADAICDFTSAKHTRFIQQLPNSINQITTYSSVYRIGLNAGKTAHICFPGKRHTSKKHIKHATINNTNIPKSQHSKISRSHIRFITLIQNTHQPNRNQSQTSFAYTPYIINRTAHHPPPCFAYTKRSFALYSNTVTSLPSPCHPKTRTYGKASKTDP